jgi:hypothetical protein
MGPERSEDGGARRGARGRPRGPDGVRSPTDDTECTAMAAADRRWREARALKAELQAGILRGTLVNRVAWERRTEELARRHRDAVLLWPARRAAVLAARLGRRFWGGATGSRGRDAIASR